MEKRLLFFVTLKRLPLVFPAIVKVIVEVPTLDESVQVYSAPTDQSENALIVVMFVRSLFVTPKPTTEMPPSRMLPVPFSTRLLKAMLCPVFVRTAALATVSVAAAVTVEDNETVPLIERL